MNRKDTMILESIIRRNGLRAVNEAMRSQKADVAEYREEFAKVCRQYHTPESYADAEVKAMDEIIRLSDNSLIGIRKPRIEKDFCFGYSCIGQGNEYEDAIDAAASYRKDPKFFIEANLHELEKRMKAVQNGLVGYRMIGKSNIAELEDIRYGNRDNVLELSREDRIRVVKTYESVIDRFHKRLENYVKKYGTEKLHIWTYCVDD